MEALARMEETRLREVEALAEKEVRVYVCVRLLRCTNAFVPDGYAHRELFFSVWWGLYGASLSFR